MTSSPKQIDTGSWILLLILSVLWGGSFLFAGLAVKELPPLLIVAARVVIASMALLPVHLLLLGALPKSALTWRNYLVMSLLNNIIPFTCIVVGQTMIASGLASVINATTPLFTVLILASFREERLTGRRTAGLLFGILGVATVKGSEIVTFGQQSTGILLCLLAAASYGFAGLWAKRKLTGTPAITSATCQLICSSFVMIPIVTAFSSPSSLLAASTEVLSAVIALAVLSTAVAYIVFFSIVQRAGASAVMLVTMLIPVSAIIMGYLFLHETLAPREILGALIVGIALLVIDGRLFRNRLGRSSI